MAKKQSGEVKDSRVSCDWCGMKTATTYSREGSMICYSCEKPEREVEE